MRAPVIMGQLRVTWARANCRCGKDSSARGGFRIHSGPNLRPEDEVRTWELSFDTDDAIESEISNWKNIRT